MIAVYIGVYICILAILWGFFFVARLHSYKFKHFSKNIIPVTTILLIFLLTLSILGFVLLFFLDGTTREVRIDTTQKVQKNYY